MENKRPYWQYYALVSLLTAAFWLLVGSYITWAYDWFDPWNWTSAERFGSFMFYVLNQMGAALLALIWWNQ